MPEDVQGNAKEPACGSAEKMSNSPWGRLIVNFIAICLARPEGFEPQTNGFGSHYSIQLSYGRLFKLLYTFCLHLKDDVTHVADEARCWPG